MNEKLRYVAARWLDTASGPVDPTDRERERPRWRVDKDAATTDESSSRVGEPVVESSGRR